MSLLRRSLVLGAAALALGATTASAQMMSKPKEVRIDMLTLATSDGNTGLTLGFPGTLAIAIYMNDNIAIEPFFSLDFASGDGVVEGGSYALGVMVPYYLAGGQGKTGIFVAPGLQIGNNFGDQADVFGDEMAVNYGLDVGIKREWKTNVGQRFAINVRDGDSFAELAFGVTAGITIRWP
jgi:hypothetical protein